VPSSRSGSREQENERDLDGKVDPESGKAHQAKLHLTPGGFPFAAAPDLRGRGSLTISEKEKPSEAIMAAKRPGFRR
jgi:hypothetical protein